MSMKQAGTALPVDEARRRILEICLDRRTPMEQVALQEARLRVAGRNIVAPRDLPPFANSAMDGFALRGTDLPSDGTRRLRIVGTRLAGSASELSIGPGECLRITTGALLPAGADTVVIKERVRVDGETAIVQAGEISGAHVRPAGEDFRAGEVVVHAGERITFARIAAIASLGLATIEVSRRPRVTILTTGDELVMPGHACSPAQIYNSNGYSLSAMLAISGVQQIAAGGADTGAGFGHLGDDVERIRVALSAAAAQGDVVITSGGVSVGEADYLPRLVGELGCIHFWKVRMRPGMPFLFGEIGNALVFCLPGNPVSTMATLLALVGPGLAAMQGCRDVLPRVHAAKLATAIRKSHDRTEFLRARIEVDDEGTCRAWPLAGQGSAMLRGVVQANGLIVIPESTHDLESGEMVTVMPLPECS